MDYIIEKLPQNAKPIGDGFYRIGHRVYQEADAIDYASGEVKGRVFRDIRFEYHDPTPVEIPIYLKRAETTDQRIKRMMNEQRAWEAWCARVDEGLADLDDFEVVERPEYTSRYENYLDLRREARRISDDELQNVVKSKKQRRNSDKFTEPSPENGDKSDITVKSKSKSKIGHNKGPKLDPSKE